MVTVVKIGGSLFPEHTEQLCETLVESNEKIVLVNGGGQLANKLREYDEKYHYSDEVNHWNAITCMDIIGNCIADKNEHIQTVRSLEDIEKVHKQDGIPLLLCYDLLKRKNPLENSWNITSDSIACWLAHKINAKLLILSNVDGIYNGSISSNNKKLVRKIRAEKLLFFKETCVDKCLPKLLINYNLNCYVMNGKYPDRVLNHLNSDKIINNYYTKIIGEE